MLLSERDLYLEVPASSIGEKFDGPSHRLSHCLKSVDFVIETASHYLYVELKDPEDPSNVNPPSDFLDRFLSGSIDEALVGKYRDTWIYKVAFQKVRPKPIKYLVLIAGSQLGSAELANRAARLRHRLPAKDHTGGPCPNFVEDCLVFNIETWNRTFPTMMVKRHSAT